MNEKTSIYDNSDNGAWRIATTADLEQQDKSQACARCGAKWRALLYANGQSLCKECFDYKVGIRQ